MEDLEYDLNKEKREHDATLENLQTARDMAIRTEEEVQQLRVAVDKMRQEREANELGFRQLGEASSPDACETAVRSGLFES